MLCEVCESIFQCLCGCPVEYNAEPRLHHHHDSLRNLKRSADQGCLLCVKIWQALGGDFNSDGDITYSIHGFSYTYIDGVMRDILSLVVYGPGIGPAVRFTLYPQRPEMALPLLPELPASTSSAKTIRQVSEWFSHCLRDHSLCRQQWSRRSNYRPRRLLKIGTVGDSNVQLVDSHELPLNIEDVTYTTLSHCWGSGHDPPKLTAQCLLDMKQRISLRTLPATFRDAIMITRSLNIPYIWIDSLCIIQDNEIDWKRESAMMDQIYRNGICNIAATASTDGRGGCFRPRDPYLTAALWTPILKTLTGTKLLYNIGYKIPWEYEVEREPLNRRGWVLQERLFSHRTLHCSTDQLYWSCEQLWASELFPWSLEEMCPGGSPGRLPVAWTTDLDTYKQWDSLIHRYTEMALSRERDKLVAISGIAKQFGQLLDDEYLAGLWARNLPSQLVWRCVALEDKNPGLVADYRAPSWSWASVKGPVFFDSPSERAGKFLIKVQESQTNRDPDNPFGAVYGGYIRLRCTLLKSSSVKHCLRAPIWDDRTTACHGDTYFMASHSGNSILQGLILDETGNADGEYRRIGKAWTFDQDEKSRQEILALLKNDPEADQHPCESYDRERGHVIKLV